MAIVQKIFWSCGDDNAIYFLVSVERYSKHLTNKRPWHRPHHDWSSNFHGTFQRQGKNESNTFFSSTNKYTKEEKNCFIFLCLAWLGLAWQIQYFEIGLSFPFLFGSLNILCFSRTRSFARSLYLVLRFPVLAYDSLQIDYDNIIFYWWIFGSHKFIFALPSEQYHILLHLFSWPTLCSSEYFIISLFFIWNVEFFTPWSFFFLAKKKCDAGVWKRPHLEINSMGNAMEFAWMHALFHRFPLLAKFLNKNTVSSMHQTDSVQTLSFWLMNRIRFVLLWRIFRVCYEWKTIRIFAFYADSLVHNKTDPRIYKTKLSHFLKETYDIRIIAMFRLQVHPYFGRAHSSKWIV